jgi:hypothetical protein
MMHGWAKEIIQYSVAEVEYRATAAHIGPEQYGAAHDMACGHEGCLAASAEAGQGGTSVRSIAQQSSKITSAVAMAHSGHSQAQNMAPRST